MPAKPAFNDDQCQALWAAAARVRKQFKNQEEMAVALHLTQQSVGNLLKRKYRPGLTTARAIANLEGMKLEDLIGDLGAPSVPDSQASVGSFTNLDVCISFYASTKHWSPWTIAAARAGFFGPLDFPPPEWVPKLEALEKVLERARKVT